MMGRAGSRGLASRLAAGALVVVAAGALTSITLAGASDPPTIASYYYYYNTPPTAVNDAYATDEDTTLTVPAPGVLANDTDEEGDPLTAELVSGPSHASSFALNANGSFTYTPEVNFFGADTFTYRAFDGAELSNLATVTITVRPVNDPPTILVTGGICTESTRAECTVRLTVDDVDNDENTLVVTAHSNNQVLFPNSNLTPGGSGANRTLHMLAAPMRSGSAVITVTVSDGEAQASVDITAKVGTAANNTLTGTSGPDVLFGLGGRDNLSGLGGVDLLCGGFGNDTLEGGAGNDVLDGMPGNDVVRGGDGDDMLFGGNNNDTLTGNLGADFFSGGFGADTNTDFTPAQGDTSDGT
jgi:Ca2+-binding RTX toxin-like protein